MQRRQSTSSSHSATSQPTRRRRRRRRSNSPQTRRQRRRLSSSSASSSSSSLPPRPPDRISRFTMRTVSPASNIQNEPTINVETTMNVEPTMNVDNNYMDENNPNYIINDDWINELRDFVENLDEEDIEQIFNVNDNDPQHDNPRPLGVAHEIHNRYYLLNKDKLLTLITPVSYNDSIENFKRKVHQFIDNLCDIYVQHNGENASQLREWKTELQNKINSAINSIPYSDILLYNSVIEYVNRQNRLFQMNYIWNFINESMNAYSSGSSCVGGIRERIVLSLAGASLGQYNNEEYVQISALIFPELISYTDQQLFHFISTCIMNNSNEGGIKDQLQEMIGNIDLRKQSVVNCVLEKMNEIHRTTVMRNRLLELIDTSIDMLTDESLSGGRKKRRRFTSKKRNKRR